MQRSQSHHPIQPAVPAQRSAPVPLDPKDLQQIGEEVARSWYRYPDGQARLHPFEGHTEPHYTGPKPPYEQLDEQGAYSWLKTPRWNGAFSPSMWANHRSRTRLPSCGA